MNATASGGATRPALAVSIVALTIWGMLPLIFQQLGRLGAGPAEILAHRVLWSIPGAVLFVTLARQWDQVRQALSSPRTMGWLALTALLTGVNWLTYVIAANMNAVLETSLGFYINPLLNMAVGAALFRERLDRAGMVAVGLAAVGVALQAVALGHLPVISLMIAVTFTLYAVIRKRITADAQAGMLLEIGCMGVAAAAYVLWLAHDGGARFGSGAPVSGWLVFLGLLSICLMVSYVWVSRRLSFTLLAFLQFISPTISFSIGAAQGEPLSPLRLGSFALIWAGVLIYALSAWRKSRL